MPSHPLLQPSLKHDRVVREPERRAITGVPPSSWYPLMEKGLAPKPVPLGLRAVGWLLSELEDWIDAQRAKRDSSSSR